jgi:hypothetical protein
MVTIGIVGSGPSGAATALMFLKAGYQVELFDLGFNANSSKDRQLFESDYGPKKLKSLYGEFYPYDFNEFNVVEDHGGDKSWFTSKGLGGFSTIWGATWKPFPTLDDPEWQAAYRAVHAMVFKEDGGDSSFGNQLKHLGPCSCFDDLRPQAFRYTKSRFMAWDITVSESLLAVSEKKCTFCGDCQIGCGQDAIWSSIRILDECMRFKNFKLMSGHFVTAFESMADSVRVQTSAGNYFVDYLFIACGPIASSSLILKSVPAIKHFDLSDTAMITIPFLSLRSKKDHIGAFSLSGRDFNFSSFDSHKTQLHMQLYSHSEHFIERALAQFPKFIHPLIRFGMNALRSRIFIGLLYVDSRWSGKLRVSWSAKFNSVPINPVIASKNLNRIRVAIAGLRRQFGILAIWPLAKYSAVGDSYHLGMTSPRLTNNYGELRDCQRVYAVGSLAIPTLEPGPITMTAMAHAVLCANKLIQALPKL